MTTTRERLRALAINRPTNMRAPQWAEHIALAAYRMAIEDAARACDGVSECDANDPAQAFAAAIRALADEVGE